MNTSTRFLIPTLAAGAFLLPACSGSFDFALGEKGSGVAETTTFDLESFDGVRVAHDFDAQIELVEGPPTVEITVDDNFTDDLEVEVRNGRLEIDLDGRDYRAKVTPTAIITVPTLNYVHASGASNVTVEGALNEASISLDASGASELRVDVETGSLTIDASGASSVIVGGTTDRLDVDASGASDIDLDDIVAGTGTVDGSGASSISIGDATEIDGDLSGAATLRAPGDAINWVDTSGGAGIDRR